MPLPAPVVRDWHRRHPQVTISLRESVVADEIFGLMEADEVDVLLLPGPVVERHNATLIAEEEIVPFAPRDHRLARAYRRSGRRKGLPLNWRCLSHPTAARSCTGSLLQLSPGLVNDTDPRHRRIPMGPVVGIIGAAPTKPNSAGPTRTHLHTGTLVGRAAPEQPNVHKGGRAESPTRVSAGQTLLILCARRESNP
ncbi:LysR substrate-binding domain-containing protein [Micromonospora sp. BQ11]|uniref:LysR substrate-binding domain-containing protein n=1 Tax=Micromonospora sp. BQ11 TaxID=3452212 RepID=UPI003F8B5AD5